MGYVPPSENKKEIPPALKVAIAAALAVAAGDNLVPRSKEVTETPAKAISGLKPGNFELPARGIKETREKKNLHDLTDRQLSTLEDREHREALAPIVENYCKKFGVPPEILWGMIYAESGGRHTLTDKEFKGKEGRKHKKIVEEAYADYLRGGRRNMDPRRVRKSKKNAYGYTGLKEVGVKELNLKIKEMNAKKGNTERPFYDGKDLLDPEKNIMMAAELLQWTYDHYAHSDWRAALVIYNQGYGNVLERLNERHNPDARRGMGHYVARHKRGERIFRSPYVSSIVDGYKKIMNVMETGKYPVEEKKSRPTHNPAREKIAGPKVAGPTASVWPHRK